MGRNSSASCRITWRARHSPAYSETHRSASSACETLPTAHELALLPDFANLNQINEGFFLMTDLFRRIAIAVLAAVSPAAVSAQAVGAAMTAAQYQLLENGLCGLNADELNEVLAPLLAGVWTSRNGAGIMTGVGAPIILQPQSGQFSNTVSLLDGSFSVASEKGEFPMDFYGGNLNFDPPGAVEAAWEEGALAALDNEILSSAAGCQVNDLPKVHIYGSFFEAEGEVEFDTYLAVISPGSMYGVIIVRVSTAQGNLVVRRSVSMTRMTR